MTDVEFDLSRPNSKGRLSSRRLAIILSLILILAAAGAALFMVRGVENQIRDMMRTFEIREQASKLIQLLTDAETGQRGYLLTVDPLYLEPYQNTLKALDSTYENLLALVVDNPGQRSRIEGLRTAISQKRDELATTIQLASEGRLQDAINIIRSDEGRVLMDGLRTTIGDFVASENITLIERNQGVESYRTALVTAILAALTGAAALAYTLFNRTQVQVSQLSRDQGRLLSLNEDLEDRVKERTIELEESRSHAERERERVEALLQDTNHRIGNSLATVSSLLGLQLKRSKSDEVRAALEAAQARVHAIASGHRRLRLGDDLETARADEFLEAVTEDLKLGQVSSGRIAITGTFEPLIIKARDATTIGILVGELITNAIKHAFPGDRSGTVTARLYRHPQDGTVLSVEDDGVGFNSEMGVDEAGLGTLIIKQLSMQFGGTPQYQPRVGGGTLVRILMPALSPPESAEQE